MTNEQQSADETAERREHQVTWDGHPCWCGHGANDVAARIAELEQQIESEEDDPDLVRRWLRDRTGRLP